MYLPFFELKRSIFQFNTNPEFVWMGDKSDRILSSLEHNLLNQPGVYQLTGDVGTGKSTLVNILIKRLPDRYIAAEVTDGSLRLMDVLNYLSTAYEIGKKFKSQESFEPEFKRFLTATRAKGKKILLVIDESQALCEKRYAHLEWLAGLDDQTPSVFSILLVGQRDIRRTKSEGAQALVSRIRESYNVDPLELNETVEYVQQSLKYAGAEREIFTMDALQAVYQLSNGVLRNINILCDNALLAAHFRQEKEITRNRVKESGTNFEFSPKGRDSKALHTLESGTARSTTGAHSPIKIFAVIGVIGIVVAGIFYYNSISFPPDFMEDSPRSLPATTHLIKEQEQLDAVIDKEKSAASDTTALEQDLVIGAPKNSPVTIVKDKEKILVPAGLMKKTDTPQVQPLQTGTLDTATPLDNLPLANVNNVNPVEQTESVLNGNSLTTEKIDNADTEDTLGESENEIILITPSTTRSDGDGPASKKRNQSTVSGGESLKITEINKSDTDFSKPPEQSDEESLDNEEMPQEKSNVLEKRLVQHSPPERTYENEEMVQPYTEPPEENAEEIDPGAVIDWLIEKRKKQ